MRQRRAALSASLNIMVNEAMRLPLPLVRRCRPGGTGEFVNNY
jgi:hypothetical protein